MDRRTLSGTWMSGCPTGTFAMPSGGLPPMWSRRIRAPCRERCSSSSATWMHPRCSLRSPDHRADRQRTRPWQGRNMAFLDPGQPVNPWLLGIAHVYGLVVRLRIWCYRRGFLRSSRLPCRVISVGNLTVGGTGKTPLVMLLANWLTSEGQRVAILSRGYKRIGSGSSLLISDGTRMLAGPSEAGDEPFLIARHCPEAIVAVGADRAALGRWILAQFSVDCVLLDDGFQH